MPAKIAKILPVIQVKSKQRPFSLVAPLLAAVLLLGNLAAFLRVVPLLFAPLFSAIALGGTNLYLLLFGLSGPIGLALAACLTINLWPTLRLRQG